MKLKIFKKKLTLLSVILILTGAMISAVGFGIGGFNCEKLKSNNHPWYQTVHVSDKGIWYGIDLGNNIHPFTIGNSDIYE